MRAVWGGFALGVVWLQQQAMLPAGAAGSGSASRRVCLRASRSEPAELERRRAAGASGRWCAVWLAAFCIGFGYAAWRAHARLAFALPAAWEGRDIDVRGHIKGLPTRNDDGVRFLFAVESADVPIARFPRTIQLSWIVGDGDAPPPLLEPARAGACRCGSNVRTAMRISACAIAKRRCWRAISRATGYVNNPSAAVRLVGTAQGVGVTIDRWRAALRARIDAVLADAPHRGIVVALAIGAQDAVSAADWQLMRATGTSHLVAISGLHIGFVAGLAAWMAGGIWRRSGFIGRDWPLVLPAQKVAAVGGAGFAAFHAALAGFNVPAQRALWMLAVVALAFVSGRTVAPSLVLAWALGLVLTIDPWAVVSAGFWLSFCAVAAILFAMSARVRIRSHERPDPHDDPADATRAKRVAAALRRGGRALAERVRSGAHVQFAVTIALAPLTVYWFAQIPLIGPLANAFAIPWVSALVTPLVLAGVALPAPLDAFAFHGAHLLLEALAAGLHALSGPAWALWRLPQPDAWTLASAAVGVAWCLAPRGWPLRCAAPLTWLPLLVPPPSGLPHGAFRLTALDIGQGSSIVVERRITRCCSMQDPEPNRRMRANGSSCRICRSERCEHARYARDQPCRFGSLGRRASGAGRHRSSSAAGRAAGIEPVVGQVRARPAHRRCRARRVSIGSGTVSTSRYCGPMPDRCRASRTRIAACCA